VRLRALLGRNAPSLPLIWWNAMPFWTDPGVQMLREVAAAMAEDATQHVVIGWPMTADVDPRDGDGDHIAKTDNFILGQRAAPVIARAVLAAAGGDTISQIPTSVPAVGGPRIVHAYRQNATHVVLTIQHDAGDDLLLPGTASSGTGFTVMDGGSVASPGLLRHTTACTRIDATRGAPCTPRTSHGRSPSWCRSDLSARATHPIVMYADQPREAHGCH
jgi:hypothetical protein